MHLHVWLKQETLLSGEDPEIDVDLKPTDFCLPEGEAETGYVQWSASVRINGERVDIELRQPIKYS